MKLASLETGIVLLPNDEPLAGFSENPNAKNPIVWLKLRTDDGIEGLGVTYFGGALTRTLRQAVDELGALVIGEDPLRVEATAQKLRDAAGSSGPAGILTMAMSAIDVALWDIKGKALGLPLWKLLGGGRDRIPTYASGALRRGLKLEEAATAAGRLRDKSYRQTKMQLGLPGATLAGPGGRAGAADPRGGRPRYGPDVRHQPALAAGTSDRYRPPRRASRGGAVLARRCDGGRRLPRPGACGGRAVHPGRGRRIPLGHHPVPPHAGGALGRHRHDRPGALGGITPWLKMAGMAEAFNVPVVSHGVPEIHVHLVGAVPNGLTVEYMPRLFPLWKAVPQPKDGMLDMPAAPGLGLEFDEAAIAKYRA
jgi:L-talarate/galactarate dehydratase